MAGATPTNGPRQPMADLWPRGSRAYISGMCPGKDNHLDWTATATPQGERVLPSLSPQPKRVVPQTRRSVMETLLGQNDLTAIDASGSDPYNATGRQFRR